MAAKRFPAGIFWKARPAGLATLALNKSGAAAVTKPARKPNILWIMSDEHNHKVAGCYGNKLAQTPNIDGLAAHGITFDTHYCNSPLCVPSRSSLTAGKYVSRVDVWGNTSELPTRGDRFPATGDERCRVRVVSMRQTTL